MQSNTHLNECDASPNPLKDSNVSLKVKTMKEGVEVHSLTCSISGVRGLCWSFEMGTRMNDKQVNYSFVFTQTKQQVC
jgi:hypothetical protein